MSAHEETPRPVASAKLPILDNALARRDFLKLGGGIATTAALTTLGCQPPQENSLPFVEMPEGLRTQGRPKFYATVSAGAPVLVRTREGRPILITPNPACPAKVGVSVRAQAALLDLYDPDRAQGPLSIRRGKGNPLKVDWLTVGTEVVRQLKAKAGDVVLLTEPITGPATTTLIADLVRTLNIRHVSYSPLGSDVQTQAAEALFGRPYLPRPNLAHAALIVGFGAEFLDQPETGMELEFAKRREPNAEGGMSRFIQLEGRLSLTGANADTRIRVRDSQLANVAAALAHTLIVSRKYGPLASNEAVIAALTPFAPSDVQTPTGLTAQVFERLADELINAAGRAVVLSGITATATTNGLTLETAVALINLTLGNYEGPAFDRQALCTCATPGPAALASLVEAMKAGQVKTLILAGVNPVYDAPRALGFAEALASVELLVSLNDRLDETSRLCDYLAPASHPLESWSDTAMPGIAVAVAQPVLRPLYDTHGLTDILVSWGASAGSGGALEAAALAARPDAKNPAQKSAGSAGYHFIRNHLVTHVVGDAKSWDDLLRSGFVAEATVIGRWTGLTPPASPNTITARPLTTDPGMMPLIGIGFDTNTFALTDAGLQALPTLMGKPTASPADLELQLYPHFALHDGRQANNGWLQELPDPITRLTWASAVSIAPKRFAEMGLKDGDLMEVSVGEVTLTLPAYRHAGLHNDQLAIPLGQGRTHCGEIGKNVGVNAFTLMGQHTGRFVRAALPVTLKKQGGFQQLPGAQGADVIDRKPRPLVPLTTLAAYQKNPKSGTEQEEGGRTIWPEREKKGPQWGMAIDLNKCTGCAKCVVGCQAENNIPVVGPQTIIAGREMSWLRIDRYYDAPEKAGGWGDEVWAGPLDVVEEPVTVFEPMLCQHCENAPCETVCPFNATMHSEDGLNQQVYNRCVGTRYCANNCPFKVRRYNWFEYSKAQTNPLFSLVFPEIKAHAIRNTRGRMQMKNNPEVTVRSRGVMEKCSFCVQRIREARAESTRQGNKATLKDGDVVTACMEACPTEAIVFGDLNDPNSRAAKLCADARSMRLLESVGVKPAVHYLTKVRNDNT